jgi:Tfp pilus assembly pilus retraction ATPase PilT
MQDVFPEEHAALLRRILADKLRAVCAQMLLDRMDSIGRVAVYGVLIPDDEMRRAIMDGSDVLKRKKPLPQGCQTMEQDIQNLFEQGIISEQTKENAIMQLC